MVPDHDSILPAGPLLSFVLERKLATAMAFVETCLTIVSACGVAAHVLSRRNVGRLSWRRTAFIKGGEVGWGYFSIDWPR